MHHQRRLAGSVHKPHNGPNYLLIDVSTAWDALVLSSLPFRNPLLGARSRKQSKSAVMCVWKYRPKANISPEETVAAQPERFSVCSADALHLIRLVPVTRPRSTPSMRRANPCNPASARSFDSQSWRSRQTCCHRAYRSRVSSHALRTQALRHARSRKDA